MVFAVVWVVTESAAGHVLVAIRDNERRVEVLGLRPFGFKLMSYTVSAVIAAGAGVIYILLIGTAVPSAIASVTLTLSVVIMVVLGGAASRWGAVTGGIVYMYLQQYLVKVAAEPTFARLPAALRVPLGQPQFLLGALFVLFVLFVPGGLAGALARSRLRWPRAARTARRPQRPGAGPASRKMIVTLEGTPGRWSPASTSGIGLAVAGALCAEGAVMPTDFGDAEEIESLRRRWPASSGSTCLSTARTSATPPRRASWSR